MHEQHSQPGAGPKPSAQALNQALDLIEALQADLDDLRNQLAWANRLSTLGTLSAGLAHEFNNLLTPIGSYAQLALNDLDNKAITQKALSAAVDGVSQAGRLVQATLSFAGPAPTDQDEDCPLKQIVERSLECTQPLLNREGIGIRVDVPDVRVQIDELALQQVLINLINNARKAMHSQEERKQLSIQAKRQLQTIVLDIGDTGCGIPSPIAERLFEPFVTEPTPANIRTAANQTQVQQAAATGSGLGLSICKRLIEAAGGTICAEPNSGRGTTLRITLPIS